MFRAVLKRFVPLPKVDAFARYLFIGPHPDDIETACAPTVKRLVEAGKHVSFLIVTDGRMGALDPACYGETLVSIRRAESLASAALLGVTDVMFLPFSDGGLYPVEEAAKAIAREIVRLKPAAVFAPDPNVISECHADHLKTGLAAKMAMSMAPFRGVMESLGVPESHPVEALFFYYTDKPNVCLPVGRAFAVREQAIALHKSQFDAAAIKSIVTYFQFRSIRLGLKRLRGRCDGYRALSSVHMHCFPEASSW